MSLLFSAPQQHGRIPMCEVLVPMEAATGNHLNNMPGEKDIHPLSLHRIKGGDPLPSMKAPFILLRDERPALIPGSGGSNRLRGAILQVLLRHSMQAEATGDPRRGIGVAWA